MTTRVTKAEELTDAMEAAYIKAGGVHCPYCKAGDHLECSRFDVGFGEAHQRISCGACGADWVDSYKLVGVIP